MGIHTILSHLQYYGSNKPVSLNISIAVAAKHYLMNARNRSTNNNKHEKETDIHGTSYPFAKRRYHDHIRISLLGASSST
jgi:hypothetical protein